MIKKTIKIGTRGSNLALVQTNLVVDKIKELYPNINCEIKIVTTYGDRNLDKPLYEFDNQGIFVDEFEEKILSGEIDIAIHSAKDMPLVLPQGLEIVSVLKREDARDVLITTDMPRFSHKELASVGTSSLRREAQIKNLYQNIDCQPIRGNINARLELLKSGVYDGIILAAAGIKRLKISEDENFQFKYLEIHEFIPAPGQGIIAIEGKYDGEWNDIFNHICDINSKIELEIERRSLQLLQGHNNDPIGVYSKVYDNEVEIWMMKEKDGIIKKEKGRDRLERKEELIESMIGRLI